MKDFDGLKKLQSCKQNLAHAYFVQIYFITIIKKVLFSTFIFNFLL